MLELAVLGLLNEQPLHGYELKKRLSETLGPLWGISFGSLYPALRRLERSGAITETVSEGDDGPAAPIVPTGSVKGDLAAALRRRPRSTRRTRKAYRLTDAGRELFIELLTAPETDDERSFALRLSFCRHLTGPERLSFLERRRTQLTQRLAPVRRTAPSRTVDRYTRSLLEHRAQTTQHDLEWIDELIAEERELVERTEEGAASA
ncbi:MAG: PadR family transcriptional regulator [Actinomycetota bacterium]|nr:PadR family transcriptional regulator [Actinomycetota bacterium]